MNYLTEYYKVLAKNLHDHASMLAKALNENIDVNLEQQYKLRSEILKEHLNFLYNVYMYEDSQVLSEAGLKKAMRTGNKEDLAKEGKKAGERRKRLLAQAGEMGKFLNQAARKYGPYSKEVSSAALKQHSALSSAAKVGENLEDIDVQLYSMDPNLRNRSSGMYMKQSDLGPDVFPSRFIHTPETPERKMGRRIG